MAFEAANTVIFDLDGTLIDSAPVVAEVLNDMRKQLGRNSLEPDFYRKWISRGAVELVAASMGVDVGNVGAYVSEFRLRYRHIPTPLSCLYPGVLDTVTFLSRQGIKLGICSNKPEYLCRKIIAETGLDEMLAVIVGGDTLPVSKPFREPVDYVIQQLGGLHESAVMVGDSTVDQHAAAAANIPFIFFSNGYDDGVDRTKALNMIARIPQLLDINLFKDTKKNSHGVLC